MRFFHNWFMMGACLSLEGMRRTFIGGSSLSLFIIKDFGLTPHAWSTLKLLEGYLAIEQSLIENIPPVIHFVLTPWVDHHNSGVLYLQILHLLAESEFPVTCDWYWKQPAYPNQQNL
jgi:hypothetical protein